MNTIEFNSRQTNNDFVASVALSNKSDPFLSGRLLIFRTEGAIILLKGQRPSSLLKASYASVLTASSNFALQNYL